MRKRRFIAFYDVLFYSLISGPLMSCSIFIFVFGELNNFEWMLKNWYLILLFSVCMAIPLGSVLFLQRVTIDLDCDKVDFYYIVNSRKNERDYNTNWNIYPSEIEKITVVKLTKEEKRYYTSAKFLFSKYLKIEMKYGHVKYVYVSHYSNLQIKKIIKMLTYKKNTQQKYKV